MKTNQYLVDFYTNYDEDSRLAEKHGSVEFLTTMRYIKRYISTMSLHFGLIFSHRNFRINQLFGYHEPLDCFRCLPIPRSELPYRC